MPKATVQAALGGVVLGQAEKGDNDDNITQGENILTIAVLCILVTAPIGAILTAFLGPLFLHKENTEEVVPMNPATSNDEQAKIVN